MKVEPIDRNWLLSELDHDLSCFDIEEAMAQGADILVPLYGIVKMIQEAPQLSDEEIWPKSEWVWDDDGYLRCNRCKQKAPVVHQFDDEPMTTATRFCHSCGAMMHMEGRRIR